MPKVAPTPTLTADHSGVRPKPKAPPPVQEAWHDRPELSGESKKNGGCLRRHWADDHSTLRRAISVIVLILYSFAGGAIFYAIEHSNKNFWECLSFVNSIFTTIGYGSIKPDTTLGKVFTIFYALIGLPTMIKASSDMSLIMLYWVGKLWIQVRRFRRAARRALCDGCLDHNSHAHIVKTGDSIYVNHKEEKLPLSFALIILLLWLVISSVYFYLTSHDWSLFIAFYFLFISVSTIGLGDYAPHDQHTAKTVSDFIFIIGGMALFSLCIRLFIVKMETLDDKVAQRIINEYTSALHDRYAFDISDELAMERSEREQRAIIHRLVKRDGGCWMRMFFGRRVEEKMLQEYKRRLQMRTRSTQTTRVCRNVAVMFSPTVGDVQTMHGESFLDERRRKRIVSPVARIKRGKGTVMEGKDHCD